MPCGRLLLDGDYDCDCKQDHRSDSDRIACAILKRAVSMTLLIVSATTPSFPSHVGVAVRRTLDTGIGHGDWTQLLTVVAGRRTTWSLWRWTLFDRTWITVPGNTTHTRNGVAVNRTCLRGFYTSTIQYSSFVTPVGARPGWDGLVCFPGIRSRNYADVWLFSTLCFNASPGLSYCFWKLSVQACKHINCCRPAS